MEIACVLGIVALGSLPLMLLAGWAFSVLVEGVEKIYERED